MSNPSNSGAARQSARSLATAYAEIDKLKENNERLAEQLQLLGGFGTLINVLQNGLEGVVGELQPLRDLATTAAGTEPPGTPLGACTANRLVALRASLDRVRSDSYSITIAEVDVGFLHDPPEGPHPRGPVASPPDQGTTVPGPQDPKNPHGPKNGVAS